ncbi:cell division cycle 20.2, cofactor of APC complex-like [Neltuma alba]|uniref:cell division cycle 20.2, cofactor of APC complex-like n=1 Tax=Neltuma alba TaxID=207710 RepID=UPI0010A4AADA|nr:cell division cycle 20.2, cofactor of APC complex-like [Prosopis alba]
MDTHRNSSPGQNIDRFIPNRSAMDLGFAHCMLTQPNKGEPADFGSSWLQNSKARQVYKRQLAEAPGVNRTRILAFRQPIDLEPSSPMPILRPFTKHSSGGNQNMINGVIIIDGFIVKTVNYSHKYLSLLYLVKPHKMSEAPFTPDVYLNTLDWSSRNVLCFAVEDWVYTWNPLDDSFSIVAEFHLRQWGGLFNSHVQIWDATTSKRLRMFTRGHRCRVGVLPWNNDQTLTTGGADTYIVNHDIPIPSHIVETYSGHFREVCGLKWSESGQRLASKCKDTNFCCYPNVPLVHICDRSMASSTTTTNNNNTQWLHRFAGHRGSVKALACCPFRVNLLASGGHDDDKFIKLWDIGSGACVESANAGSQVSGLLWNKEETELLSSHGVPYNDLILWKFPSIKKMAKLSSHRGSMADSPNGCTVASAALNDAMRIWYVFGDSSRMAKPAAPNMPASD